MPATYRPGTLSDSHAAFSILERAFVDMAQRLAGQTPMTVGDPANWERNRSLHEHLARTAEHFWVAEHDSEPIGYARSILRDGVRELTEFFVLPQHQSAGVGRELLRRAFPEAGARHRSIIATNNPQSLSRYLRAGLGVRFPIVAFSRKPEAVPPSSQLEIEPILSLDKVKADLNQVDQAILGYQREVDHGWLLQERRGYLYRRNGQVVGYGYVGFNNGPFALLAPDAFPDVLSQAETVAARRRAEEIAFEVPLINRAAVDYLLQRGFRMDSLLTFYMSDAPLGQLENYVVTSPPMFL